MYTTLDLSEFDTEASYLDLFVDTSEVFDISVRQPAGQDPAKVKCCGIVVSSQPEDDAYRTVIHFADLAHDDRSSLHTLTKNNRMRCADCGNC